MGGVLAIDSGPGGRARDFGVATMSRAIIYLRVSTDEQADSGLGLEAQLAAARGHAVRNGWSLDGPGPFRDEGLSGSKGPLDRPGLLDAIAALGSGDVLLVAKRDRVARGDPVLVATIEGAIEKQGARLVSAAGEGTEDDSPTSKLMRRIVDAFAEYERLLIAARTRAALAAKRARGELAGTVPYGQRPDPESPGRLVADPVEAAALECLRRWRSGGLSLGQICRRLDEERIPTKGGRPWAKSTVHALLKRLDRDQQGQAAS